MARSTTTFSVTIPTELSEQLDHVLAKRGCARSYLVSVALERYLDTRRWEEIVSEARERAVALDLQPDTAQRLIEETLEGIRVDFVQEMIEEVRSEQNPAWR